MCSSPGEIRGLNLVNPADARLVVRFLLSIRPYRDAQSGRVSISASDTFPSSVFSKTCLLLIYIQFEGLQQVNSDPERP